MADKAIKIIFVDDDASFLTTFKRQAKKKRVIVKHFLNAEEAKTELMTASEKVFAGIVLDVKGLSDKSSQIPDPSYFPKALSEMQALAPSLNIYGITGETDSREDWNKMFHQVTSIFSKELTDIDNLLDTLQLDAKNIPHIKLMNKYKNSFEKAEKLLEKAELSILLEALDNMGKGGAEVQKTLSSLRRILEAVFREINKVKPEIVPTELVEGEIRFRPIMKHLRDEKILSSRHDYIYKLLDTAYTCMSNHGSHLDQTANFGSCHKPAGVNAVRTCTFAVMDVLDWGDAVVNSN